MLLIVFYFFFFHSIPFLYYDSNFKHFIYLSGDTDEYFLMTSFSLSSIYLFHVFFFFFVYFGLCFTLKPFIKCLMILRSTFEWGIKKLTWGSVSRSCWLACFILESFRCWTTSSLRTKIFFSGQFSVFKEVIFHFLCVEDAWFPAFCIWGDRGCWGKGLVT